MSTRARLTISYAFVLLVTMIVFAVSVWAGRRETATRDQTASEVFRTADRVLSLIQTAQLQGRRLTAIDTDVNGKPGIRATKDMGDLLDAEPGYFMVLAEGN